MDYHIDRRAFLAAVAGLAASSVSAARDEVPQVISLGFSLYGMRGMTAIEGVEVCAKLGYDAVELAAMTGYSGDPAQLDRAKRRELRARLDDLRVNLAAIMENTPLNVDDAQHRRQLDRLTAAAELGHELSPNRPPVIETILGGRPGEWEKIRHGIVNRLAEWAKTAERARMVIAIKPHRLNALNAPADIAALLREINSPWIKLAYDYSHFEHRNMPMADTVKSLASFTRFVHVKDVRLDEGRVRFLLPGEGTTDYVALLRLLREGGYRGCVCVEVSSMIFNQKDYDARAAARRCYENLAPAFAKAEIRRRA